MADLFVLGASMGGVSALKRLASELPPEFPGALFVVQHVGPAAQFLLPELLNDSGALECREARDGDAIEPGRILVPPPDYHLLLSDTEVLLRRGPHENRARPAIDVLFRSAAVAHGPRVVGVVLTGLLDDGSAGLLAVKHCGGITVVQDPDDAEYPEMPREALRRALPDHVLPLSAMPRLFDRLARQPAGPAPPPPEDLVFEVRMSQGHSGGAQSREQAGDASPFACPECGGVLWQLRDPDMLRFRCRVGHSYTAASLLRDQSVHLEAAIWAAIRALDERTQLLGKLARDAEAAGLDRPARTYEERSQLSLEHARVLRELLHSRRTPERDRGAADSSSTRSTSG